VNICDIVLANDIAHPDDLAIHEIPSDRRWTWRQLLEEIAGQVARLKAIGVGAGDRVITVGHHSADDWALYYACGYLQAILCPLAFRWTAEMLSHSIGELEAEIAIVGEEFQGLVEEAVRLSDCATRVSSMGDWLAEAPAEIPALNCPPRSHELPHLIIYTSGTTGAPKGVLLSHERTILDALRTIPGFGYDRSTRLLVHYPTFHTSGWDSGKLTAYSGGCLYLMGSYDVDQVTRTLVDHRVTAYHTLPTALYGVAEQLQQNPEPLDALEVIVYSAFDSRTLEDVRAAFAKCGSRPTECHMYGLTEGCPEVSMWADKGPYPPGLIGTAVPGVRLTLGDEEGKPLPLGEPFARGELLVGAESCMLGYWKDPELSAKALAHGWLHTGDLAEHDRTTSLFTLVDRAKDVVRSGGELVSSRTIELALFELPGVKDVAVIGTRHEVYEEAVTAVVEWEGPDLPTEEEFRLAAREVLPSYQVPRRVAFVDELPRNQLGKIEKSALRERFASVFGRR
jgi:acyl-CoA synthetase (AMP-forming)/AMP-acid ligase II